MKRWIAMGLLWGLGGYFLTIILIPVMSSETLSVFKLSLGAALWIVTGLAIGSLFYAKASTTKGKRKKKR